MRVYLAGPINGCTDAEANNWRSQAKALLWGVETLDPMRRDYRGRETENVRKLVNDDLDDILSCDVVLVNAERPSWGTAMEVRFAWDNAKRIIAFGAPKPSPWLLYHAECVGTLVEACGRVG